MIREKKRVIVTGGTKSDVAAIGTFALNIKETNNHMFSKLIVFHDGISKKDQKIIRDIIDVDFIKYKLPFKSKNDVIVNYFSPMLFCKYECFKLLEKYDEVVWSDYDVLIKENLDEICDFKDVGLIIVTDSRKTIRDMFYKEILNKEIYNYDLSKEALCTPLFSVSRKIGKYMDMYNWCYKKTEEYEEDLELAEQCIISLMVQQYATSYATLSPEIYACHPKDAKGKEKILHSYGQPKFWSGLKNDEWDRLYHIWLNMGGKPYNDMKKVLMSKVRLLITRILGIRSRK